MQTLLKRWTHALLEWLGLTSATGDALDRWAAFVLVVLAAVVFDLLLQLGIVHGVRKLVERTRAKWDDTLFSVPVLRRMCHILSAILLAVVLPVVFEEKSTGRLYRLFGFPLRQRPALCCLPHRCGASRLAEQTHQGPAADGAGHCAADLHDSDCFDPARQVARHPADGTGRLGGRADADFP